MKAIPVTAENPTVEERSALITLGGQEYELIPLPNLAGHDGETVTLYVYKYGEASDFTGEYIGQTTVDANGDYSFSFIGERAFYGCTRLVNVTIPDSVTYIGADAFAGVCNIVYRGTATGSPWGARCVNGFVDGDLIYSSSERKVLCVCNPMAQGCVTLPDSVTTIAESAFYGCFGLVSITIPDIKAATGQPFSGCPACFFYFWGCLSATAP